MKEKFIVGQKQVFFTIMMVSFLLVILECSSDIFETVKPPKINRLTASSYEVNPGDTVIVTVEIEDTDKTYDYTWSKDGGTFIPPEDQPQINWIAPAVGGTYHLGITVTNEDKSSDKEISITVRSLEKPLVEITSPKSGEFVVQYSQISIEADAQHNNGIQQVHLYINDIVRDNLGGHESSLYKFSYKLSDTEPVGKIEIKVRAIARVTGVAGQDSITVVAEGIVPGKY